MKIINLSIISIFCVNISAADFTTDSLAHEVAEMQKATSDISAISAKAFIEKYVNPADIKKALSEGKVLDELSAQFAASGKFAAVGETLKNIKPSEGTFNLEENTIQCRIIPETSEGYITFIYVDNKWFIKN